MIVHVRPSVRSYSVVAPRASLFKRVSLNIYRAIHPTSDMAGTGRAGETARAVGRARGRRPARRTLAGGSAHASGGAGREGREQPREQKRRATPEAQGPAVPPVK